MEVVLNERISVTLIYLYKTTVTVKKLQNIRKVFLTCPNEIQDHLKSITDKTIYEIKPKLL